MSNASPAASSIDVPRTRVAGVVLDVEQQGVAAAREQAQERRLDRVGPEEERRDVAVQVVDGRERQAARPGQRLRGRDADEQCADEPGALRDRDRVDVVERRSRLAERLAHDRDDELEMPPRRDLGDDAAVAGVQVGLRGDDVRADLALPRSRAPPRSRRRTSPDRGSSRLGLLVLLLLVGDGVAPHDQGVLAVVRVVAAPHATGDEARAARRARSRPRSRRAPRACSRGARPTTSPRRAVRASARAIPRRRYSVVTATFITCHAST